MRFTFSYKNFRDLPRFFDRVIDIEFLIETLRQLKESFVKGISITVTLKVDREKFTSV